MPTIAASANPLSPIMPNVIAANGMESAGYQYVDIDDGWASSRNTFGVIQAYTNFPDGIAFVANYVHSKGLKLGVYTDDGTNTCSTCISTEYNPIGKDPGSYGYEYLDAFTYASWGAIISKMTTAMPPAKTVT